MVRNYSSMVSLINSDLDWGFTDAEVDALKMLYRVSRPALQEFIYQLFEDANYHDVCKLLRPEESGKAIEIAKRFGLDENDDFMAALKDTMGEEE